MNKKGIKLHTLQCCTRTKMSDDSKGKDFTVFKLEQIVAITKRYSIPKGKVASN